MKHINKKYKHGSLVMTFFMCEAFFDQAVTELICVMVVRFAAQACRVSFPCVRLRFMFSLECTLPILPLSSRLFSDVCMTLPTVWSAMDSRSNLGSSYLRGSFLHVCILLAVRRER